MSNPTDEEIVANVCCMIKIDQADATNREVYWRCCYEYFMRHDNEFDLDEAACRIHTYLKKWGMMRGSGFLWKCDYTIHKSAIKILRKPGFYVLKAYDPASKEQIKSELISRLYEELLDVYEKKAKGIKRENKSTGEEKPPHGVTDTLVTKVILGTVGCLPALDRFVKASMKASTPCIQTSVAPKKREDSISAIWEFYFKHKDTFEQERRNAKLKYGFDYAPMRLLDMYFWKKGEGILKVEEDAKKKAEKADK